MGDCSFRLVFSLSHACMGYMMGSMLSLLLYSSFNAYVLTVGEEEGKGKEEVRVSTDEQKDKGPVVAPQNDDDDDDDDDDEEFDDDDDDEESDDDDDEGPSPTEEQEVDDLDDDTPGPSSSVKVKRKMDDEEEGAEIVAGLSGDEVDPGNIIAGGRKARRGRYSARGPGGQTSGVKYSAKAEVASDEDSW